MIGRRYRGLLDDWDGAYITATDAGGGEVVIDRDAYGAIPLFYAASAPIVSTDLGVVRDLMGSDLDAAGLAEYLSAAYVTGGKTIYRNVCVLMPNQSLVIRGNVLAAQSKKVFPGESPVDEHEMARLLETAIENSVDDLLERIPGALALNLSGGADSTLLLAKIRERDPSRTIYTTTYFHSDWRHDIDDWRYAARAASTFGARHELVTVDNVAFCRAHRALMGITRNVCHTYAPSFYAQNRPIAALADDVPIVNGSGPDESIIGTEKIAISELLALRALGREAWTAHLAAELDYAKLSDAQVGPMLRRSGAGFARRRLAIADGLLDAPDFVSFQRRFHAMTVLQDHIQELTAVAGALDRLIVFPYLTQDIFRIVFSTPFDSMNVGGVYKSVVKGLLERYMPPDFVHRAKIGFQSPSRPYFQSDAGVGLELRRLLAKGASAILDLDVVEPAIRERLEAEIDLYRRYDFLEWTAYNILMLEEVLS